MKTTMKTLSIFSAAAEKTKPKQEKPVKENEKPKDKTKGKPEPKVQPKKLGRPSKEAVRAKAQAEHAAKVAFGKEMLERQKLAATLEPEVVAAMDIPKYPIFLPGQRVESVIRRIDGKIEKGTVSFDSNIHSAMIRVNWDDGSSQYAAKVNLKPIIKKTYKTLFNRKKDK